LAAQPSLIGFLMETLDVAPRVELPEAEPDDAPGADRAGSKGGAGPGRESPAAAIHGDRSGRYQFLGEIARGALSRKRKSPASSSIREWCRSTNSGC
jgi:hypothetical protein